MGGGGFRGAAIGGGGFRGAAIGGGGFRGAAIGGGGFRGAAIGGGGFRGIGIPGGGYAIRRAAIGSGYGIRGGAWRPGLRPGWRPGWGWAGRPWRPGWGWGFPVAAGLVGAGAWGYGYDQCLAWDGWRWINVCYQPYPYEWY
jgi:hypothetical protein